MSDALEKLRGLDKNLNEVREQFPDIKELSSELHRLSCCFINKETNLKPFVVFRYKNKINDTVTDTVELNLTRQEALDLHNHINFLVERRVKELQAEIKTKLTKLGRSCNV